jgi:hypothetical protein
MTRFIPLHKMAPADREQVRTEECPQCLSTFRQTLGQVATRATGESRDGWAPALCPRCARRELRAMAAAAKYAPTPGAGRSTPTGHDTAHGD